MLHAGIEPGKPCPSSEITAKDVSSRFGQQTIEITARIIFAQFNSAVSVSTGIPATAAERTEQASVKELGRASHEASPLNSLAMNAAVSPRSILPDQRPWFVYLAGGPGVGVSGRSPALPYMQRLLAQGGVIVLLDQRGTGESTPIQAADSPRGCNLSRLSGCLGPEWHSAYVGLHRQDSVARDVELLRQLLLGSEANVKQLEHGI